LLIILVIISENITGDRPPILFLPRQMKLLLNLQTLLTESPLWRLHQFTRNSVD